MKKIVLLIVMLSLTFTYAQDIIEPTLDKKGDLIQVTYFHDNGNVEQVGTFNALGKLQGEWVSFDDAGNKTALGNYDNGKKVGKWFFWNDDSLKEVDYIDSRIVKVNQWDNKTKVVINDN